MDFKVLVVEDNDRVRSFLQDLLAWKNYQSAGASNGHEGIELARTYRPHVVLMDIEMPVMDGYEALKVMREDPELRHLPVIAVTGCIKSGEEAVMLARGFDHCITKPCTVETLEGVLSRYRENLSGLA